MKNAIYILAVLCGIFATGSALSCFTCNSHTDPACEDEFNRNSTALKDSFMQVCDTTYNGVEVKPFCRKTVMDVYIAEKKRIQRDCGYERREGYECYQKRSEDYIVFVCQCDEEGCNGASGLAYAPVLAILVPLITKFL